MRFLSLLASIVLLAGGAAGCVPSIDQYYYISLAHHADAQIIQSAKPANAAVYFADSAPSGYEITREGYAVRVRVAAGDYWPSVLVAATTQQGSELLVKPLVYGQCGSFEQLGMRYDIDSISAQKYVWSPAFHKNCNVGGNQAYKQDQTIKFEVLQPDGEILGSESIDFQLIRNGSYLSSDAL